VAHPPSLRAGRFCPLLGPFFECFRLGFLGLVLRGTQCFFQRKKCFLFLSVGCFFCSHRIFFFDACLSVFLFQLAFVPVFRRCRIWPQSFSPLPHYRSLGLIFLPFRFFLSPDLLFSEFSNIAFLRAWRPFFPEIPNWALLPPSISFYFPTPLQSPFFPSPSTGHAFSTSSPARRVPTDFLPGPTPFFSDFVLRLRFLLFFPKNSRSQSHRPISGICKSLFFFRGA